MYNNDNVIDTLAAADYDDISRYRELKTLSEWNNRRIL